MPSPYMRFRERLSAPPPANSVQIGVFEKRRKSDDKLVSTTPVLTGGGSNAMSILRSWDQINQKVRPRLKKVPKRLLGFQIYWVPIMIRGRKSKRLLYDIMPDGTRMPKIRWKKRRRAIYAAGFGDHHPPRGKGYSDGGPFLMAHVSLPNFTVQGQGTYRTVPEDSDPSFYYLYKGGFAEPQYGSTDLVTDDNYQKLARVPGPTAGFLPSLDGIGSEAYARLRPQLEKAGLMVALREAKDIPRMLQTTAANFHDIWNSMGGSRTSQIMHPKSVADNFLNHHFGWVPFIKDIRQFHDVFSNSEKYIEQITRDNNRWVKRVRVMEATESETLISKGGVTSGVNPFIGNFPWNMCRPQTVPGIGNTMAHWNISEQVNVRSWAMGVFRYYRPEFDNTLSDYSSQWNDLQRRLTILGARISPSNVYKSTPWTWLIDWFSNIGDHIDLVNDIAMDGVVSKYMYVMRHHVRRLVFRSTMYYWQSALTLEWAREIETKQRQRAWTPYGFNLFGKDLSPKQWAILGALGLSRNVPMR